MKVKINKVFQKLVLVYGKLISFFIFMLVFMEKFISTESKVLIR